MGISDKWIEERYAPRKVNNSFYESMPLDSGVGREYLTGEPEVIYYVEKKTGNLCAKETTLIW